MTTPDPETKIVDKKKFACDGGGHGSASGHPRVWLTIPEDTGWVVCPYCDTRFVLGENAEAAH
ncbi:MAG TPA: zinc-finger domain-containing protein [Rhodobacterales bacterium]|nr:zinc-finger domain-containing protein [Rhodobacterales bacterium]